MSGNLGRLLPLLQGLRGKLTYRYDERDNGTPQSDYSYVEGDTFPAGAATNVPYGYRRQDVSLFGEYDLGRLLRLEPPGNMARLSGGWDREEWDRSFQETDNSAEDRAWVRVQVRPVSWLTLDARYGGANRDADPYITSAGAGAPRIRCFASSISPIASATSGTLVQTSPCVEVSHCRWTGSIATTTTSIPRSG